MERDVNFAPKISKISASAERQNRNHVSDRKLTLGKHDSEAQNALPDVIVLILCS